MCVHQLALNLPLHVQVYLQGKQIQLRGQLITQIKQLHELLEAGAISLEEYNSQKAPILDKLNGL